MSKLVRLDKFLAQAGEGSRAEVKKLIRAGRILVNNEAAKNADRKIDVEKDVILLDGRQLSEMATPTVMMNKPAGVVSATFDDHDRTVIDLISEPWADKLFPMGRLDKDTEGMLILTGDGRMSHELLSPKKHVVKTYFAVISGEPDPVMIEKFRDGIDIGEKKNTLPAELIFLSDDLRAQNFRVGNAPGQDPEEWNNQEKDPEEWNNREKDPEEWNNREKGPEGWNNREKDPEGWNNREKGPEVRDVREQDKESQGSRERNKEARIGREQNISISELPHWAKSIRPQDFERCQEGECCVVISITEGKFHQIKRMFSSQGREVRFLKRLAMGQLALDPDLEPGQYKILSEEELSLLKQK